ncbi:MAG: hypothetical protein L7F77_07600 [Candidatus Magnetominusculus sp. LBB02]|nr:hypothetical protein [Candidatus Magnetominusculus sp. LBB02]
MNRTVMTSYLCAVIAIYVLLQLLGVGQCFGDDIKPNKYLKKEYASPSGKIIVRQYGELLEDNSGDIWLYSKENPLKKAFLFSYERDADVIISPDEKWIAINYRYGCDGTSIILFKRIKGLKYEIDTWLTQFAWDFFRKKYKRHIIPEFGHSYAEAVLWSSDSKSVLIFIKGHDDDSPMKLEPWYCIYDLKKEEMTLDFNRVFNRDTYHPNGRAKGRKLFKY